jgi:hypothetical protein
MWRDGPLSATRTHVLALPTTETCESGQRACAAKALPLRFWQSKQ